MREHECSSVCGRDWVSKHLTWNHYSVSNQEKTRLWQNKQPCYNFNIKQTNVRHRCFSVGFMKQFLRALKKPQWLINRHILKFGFKNTIRDIYKTHLKTDRNEMTEGFGWVFFPHLVPAVIRAIEPPRRSTTTPVTQKNMGSWGILSALTASSTHLLKPDEGL